MELNETLQTMIIKKWTTKNGLSAMVTEHPTIKHLCGYVGVGKDSPFYNIDYNEIDSYINVYGGVTFTGTFEHSDLWWIGYDCAHSGDFTAYNKSGIKRDVVFCVDECELLAEQIKDNPLEYFFMSKKIGILPTELHNQMIAWGIEDPNNELIKNYFSSIK